ncbi:ATP-binding protein [Geodermatophilus sp. SYSU D00758]
MTRRVLASYLTITAVVLAVLVLPLGLVVADHELDALFAALERDATSVAAAVEDDLEARTRPRIDTLLTGYAAGGGRIVVVDRTGTSQADSAHIGAAGEDFTNRPEFTTALSGERATGTRTSETVGGDLVYVAVPVTSGGQVHGAVRVTYPIAELDQRIRAAWTWLGLLSVVVLLVVTVVGAVLARQVTRPVRRLEDAARDLADGRLDTRVPVPAGPPELRSLAGTFNRTADRLERLLASQRRFVADAAHQLRTPLTALRLRLENLARHLPPGQEPRLQAAVDETDRLARLVESLLVLTRADAGAAAPVPVDVAEVVAGRLEVWRSVAEQRGVRLGADPGADAAVLAVPGALEQILDNLISNAIAASPPAGTVQVTVAAPSPGSVDVAVTDEGPGLLPEQQERAFDRFWQAPGATGTGFGLGLAIARRLAEAGGGTVELRPAPSGRGLRALVRLPTATTPGHEIAVPAPGLRWTSSGRP